MRAVVVGAGIAGLTTAWWLDRAGWDVVVLERAPEPRTAGYLIDFFGPGYEVAERMGLVPRLEQVRSRVTELRYVDPDGRPRGAAGYDVFTRAAGGRVLSLPRGELAASLLDSLAASVEVRWGAEVVSAEADDGGAAVTFADGGTVAADLLVGADGLHSRVRAVVFAEDGVVRSLGYHTAAYVLRDAELMDSVGPRMLMTVVPDRQVGMYPMGDGTLAVWLLHADAGPVPRDVRSALLAKYAGMGPLVDRALALCPEPAQVYYDLVAQAVVEDWVRGRAVLVGDACQAPSLMAGQGASMAMAGGWALARHLQDAGDVASGLARYAAAMRPFAEERQSRGRATARGLLPSTPAGIRVRQAFLAMARTRAGSPLVRRAFSTDLGASLPA